MITLKRKFLRVHFHFICLDFLSEYYINNHLRFTFINYAISHLLLNYLSMLKYIYNVVKFIIIDTILLEDLAYKIHVEYHN